MAALASRPRRHRFATQRLRDARAQAASYTTPRDTNDVIDKLSDSELHDQDRRFAYLDSKPLFFGHYWLDEELHVNHTSAACLDYSIAKDGSLVAYRWSGESKLASDNLRAVPKPALGSQTSTSRLQTVK